MVPPGELLGKGGMVYLQCKKLCDPCWALQKWSNSLEALYKLHTFLRFIFKEYRLSSDYSHYMAGVCDQRYLCCPCSLALKPLIGLIHKAILSKTVGTTVVCADDCLITSNALGNAVSKLQSCRCHVCNAVNGTTARIHTSRCIVYWQ